jgi:hypothetical protein
MLSNLEAVGSNLLMWRQHMQQLVIYMLKSSTTV